MSTRRFIPTEKDVLLMKIMVLADNESKFIWDFFDPEKFKDIDLMISCGDLKADYLSFLATLINAPLCYVHGNHDTRYATQPPGGCNSLEDTLTIVAGLRILGLGGSFSYNQGAYQYSEKEMDKRIRKLKPLLKKYGGFDILVTHAPAFGIGDGDDICHRGFQAFINLIKTYKPSYFLHGHQHLNYGQKAKRIQRMEDTTIINGYEYYIFDYHPNIYAPTVPIQDKVSLLKRVKTLLHKFNFFDV